MEEAGLWNNIIEKKETEPHLIVKVDKQCHGENFEPSGYDVSPSHYKLAGQEKW